MQMSSSREPSVQAECGARASWAAPQASCGPRSGVWSGHTSAKLWAQK